MAEASTPTEAPPEQDIAFVPDPRLATPAPVDTAPAPAAQPADGAPEPVDWDKFKEALKREDVPWDDLLKVDRISSRIGSTADRLATEKAKGLVDQTLANQQAAEREAERLRIAEADPDHPLSKDVLAQAAAKEQEKAQSGNAETIALASTAMTIQGVTEYLNALPPEVQKAYNESIMEDGKPKQMSLSAIVQAAFTAQLAHEKAQWEKERVPAIERDAAARAFGSEPSLDLNGAGRANDGGLTKEKYQNMTPSEAQKLLATPAGRAQVDALWQRELAGTSMAR